ncbi:MAG: exopolysaccharide biosynthesis protein [Alistipes sp.]|nr:exopolysaccharide biosynthesis protein [Alistipes sp.]
MKYFLYIGRFLYRIRVWLVLLPILSVIYMIWKTRNMERTYEAHATVYTGVVSGYDMGETLDQGIDWNTKNGTIINMMDLIRSEATLRRVSMRLFARCLIHGDPNNDNIYLNAATYRWIVERTPKYVRDLVVKEDEDKTVENFFANVQPNNKDHLYGLFMWEASKYFGVKDLKTINISRLESSDMLKIEYTNNDPGITYQTILILIKEFSDQYQQLRFGETNDAIAYFTKELADAKLKLNSAEDELTNYNLEKKVINYTDETKEVASLTKAFEMQYQDVAMAYAKAKATVESLEQRINFNVNNMRQNTIFLSKLKKVSELQTEITNIEAFGQKSDANIEKTAQLKRQLREDENAILALKDTLNENKYSQEGIVRKQFVDEWLEQSLELAKSEAQKRVMDQWKNELDQKYVFYAPIGSTIKSKEREIDFTERTYLSLQNGLNAAILRLRQLQMTTNTLKVTNEPSYPISPLPHQRKMTVTLTGICTILFVLLYFLILELIDRTLRDRIRAERITNGRVLGAIPGDTRRYRQFNTQAKELAIRFLAKAIVPYFKEKRPVVINLISMNAHEGKHLIAEMLRSYWQANGIRVKICSYHTDYNPHSDRYVLSQHFSDFCDACDFDLILVIHQPLIRESVPSALLQEAHMNVVIVKAHATWKNIDQEALESLQTQSGETPTFIVLNQTSRIVTEDFTGMLPPYTPFRQWMYRLSQLGLTGDTVNPDSEEANDTSTEES